MKTNHQQAGSTIIEFALVAFIFFLVMWGIIDFGRFFYVRNSAQQLTRCIAREAVVRLPSDAVGAEQACLTQINGKDSWPFYQLEPVDMKNLIEFTYYFKEGPPSQSIDSTYDDQFQLCGSGTSAGNQKCITNIEVCMDPSKMVTGFGLLMAWLGAGGGIGELASCTNMPAEAMGYCDPDIWSCHPH